MPRPGGESAKVGDQYEAAWTVDAVLDVFEGRFKSITVEAFGEASVGVEFHLETNSNSLQFHSVKRQKDGPNWSVADLCRSDKSTGRSILGDLLTKRNQWPNAETRFVSSTGANELRDLAERSKTPANVAEFLGSLKPKRRQEFDRIAAIFDGNAESAFAALKTLEAIPRGHNDLTRSVERRIHGLFNRVDGTPLEPDAVRCLIAEFILSNLGAKIDRERFVCFIQEKGLGIQDWKLDVTVTASVVAANRRYVSCTETELINSSHIVREVVGQITDSLLETERRGAIVAAPGGFGKSCVLAQCVSEFASRGIPYLCLRMDQFAPCLTARQLGEQLDLRASPAVVLAGVADNHSSVLVVDQLDAMSLVSGRNPQLWEAFSDLCAEVRTYPRMKMLLACRDFDLEHDHRLRRLAGSSSHFASFRLKTLTAAEVRASFDLAGLGQLEINQKQLDILSIPFHLLLFLQGNPARSFNSVGELYDQYWERKRQNLRNALGRESYWNEVIDALSRKMSERQLLFAPALVTDEWQTDARAMVSAHVLTEVEGRRLYRFFHESFFDYAYARRFCFKEQCLIEFLEASEQHLFRRAQVRQILAYRRRSDPDRYVDDVRRILETPSIRFHIKRMVASEFNRIEDPQPDEWRILEPYVLAGDLSRYVSRALRDHVGWFDLLDSLGVFKAWLASSDERLNNAAIWFLEAGQLHDCRSAEVARLILPYANLDGNWLQRIQKIMSWGQAHKSIEMTEIYLSLISRGAYDDYDSRVKGGDFWSQHYNAEKESPRFVIDVLGTWFDRAVEQFDDGDAWSFLDKCRMNRSHAGAKTIGKAASDEPCYFVEQMLPRVRTAVLQCEVRSEDAVLNRLWPSLSNNGEPLGIDEAILLCLRKSLQFLASREPEAFRKHACEIIEYPHRVFGHLLLRSWAENPSVFAEDCAQYIVADRRRLNIGYGSWSDTGEGTGDCAISRMALQAISPHCSADLFLRLESQIIEFYDDFEAKTPRWRGFSKLLLLRSLEPSRMSQRAALTIEELERKFPNSNVGIVQEDAVCRVRCVVSPIAPTAAQKMTDTQWIAAMKKYDGSADLFKGGAVELSRLLSDFSQRDRERYARLVERMPDDINPIYFSAILYGLCSRYVNQRQEEKEADDQQIAAVPTETFLLAIDRLHALPNRPCGSAIVACIRRLSDRTLPDRILDIAAHYATYDSDPTTDAWQQARGGNNLYGGDPHAHGINTVRGQAAEAIAALVDHDHSRFNQLLPAFRALSEDRIISVRTCAISAFVPLLRFDRDTGVELFVSTCGECEAIWATSSFERFVHYAIHTHYPKLRELLQFALQSENKNAVENAARQIILAELSDISVGTDASAIRTGSEAMRRAAADVYATNLADKVVGNKCAELLQEFFEDESEGVRKEVSSAFFSLTGERLLELKDVIARFIESPCFEVETDRLLHALKESNAELPQIICRAAERILEFLGEQGTHIMHHGAMVAHDIATLIVRQYEQTLDEAIKTWCLNLIDQMERNGFLGVADELGKLDR